jgi:hypothetical protein
LSRPVATTDAAVTSGAASPEASALRCGRLQNLHAGAEPPGELDVLELAMLTGSAN